MPKRRKDYTPKFKFQLVVETLQHQGSDSEIARAYGVHPVTLSKWKARFFDRRSSLVESRRSTTKSASPNSNASSDRKRSRC